MNLLTEQMAIEIFNAVKTGGAIVGKEGVDVLNQALNYLIFEEVVSITSKLSLFLLAYLIARFITAAQTANLIIADNEETKRKNNGLQLLKQATNIGFAVIFVVIAYSNVLTLGKLLIAPKMVLVERAADLIKKVN